MPSNPHAFLGQKLKDLEFDLLVEACAFGLLCCWGAAHMGDGGGHTKFEATI